MEQTVDEKSRGCERREGEKLLKYVQEYERGGRGSVKCILEGPGQHIGQEGPFWWWCLTVLEGGGVLISKAEEEGTEAVIHPEVVEGGKDRSSAWVIRTAITEGACQTGRGDFSWAASSGSDDFCL